MKNYNLYIDIYNIICIIIFLHLDNKTKLVSIKIKFKFYAYCIVFLGYKGFQYTYWLHIQYIWYIDNESYTGVSYFLLIIDCFCCLWVKFLWLQPVLYLQQSYLASMMVTMLCVFGYFWYPLCMTLLLPDCIYCFVLSRKKKFYTH